MKKTGELATELSELCHLFVLLPLDAHYSDLKSFREMMKSYFYLALTLCYFLEKHPVLESDLRFLDGNCNKSTCLSLSSLCNFNFPDYLLWLYGKNFDFEKEQDSYVQKKVLNEKILSPWLMYDLDGNLVSGKRRIKEYRKRRLQELSEYETFCTEYVQDQGVGALGYNDFFRLMFVFSQALMQNGFYPTKKDALLPAKGQVYLKYPDDIAKHVNGMEQIDYFENLYTEEMVEHLSYEEWKAMMDQYGAGCTHDEGISQISQYVSDFPEPEVFLNTYVYFRKYYVLFMERDLKKTAKDAVGEYLSRHHYNLCNDEKLFDTIFYNVFSVTEFAKEKLNEGR